MAVTPTTLLLKNILKSFLGSTLSKYYTVNGANKVTILKEILLTNQSSDTDGTVDIYLSRTTDLTGDNNTPAEYCRIYKAIPVVADDTVTISLSTFLDPYSTIWFNCSINDKISVNISAIESDYTL